MKTVHTVQNLRDQVRQWRQAGLTVGLVPTMGNLHAGHMSLVKTAKQHSDKVIVSVFVNPTQFGPNEDFDTYPRTLEQDAYLLTEHGADLLFAPSVTEMYPQETFTWVDVEHLGDRLCGAKRPGHFRGVTTVVSKLLHAAMPDHAFFGEKDYQQLAVLRRMVTDQLFATDVIGVPTERETSGLALSSRNGYLSEAEKQQALTIYRTLDQARQAIESGERNYQQLSQHSIDQLTQAGFKVDYFEVVDAHTLAPAQATTPSLRILAAAYLGSTRLIDNVGTIFVDI